MITRWLRRIVPSSLHGRMFLILCTAVICAEFASVVLFKAKLRWDYDEHMRGEAISQFATQARALTDDPAVQLPISRGPPFGSRDQIWKSDVSALAAYDLPPADRFSKAVADALEARGLAPLQVEARYEDRMLHQATRPGEPRLALPPAGDGNTNPPPLPSESFVAARLPGIDGWLNVRLRSSPPPPPLMVSDFLLTGIVVLIALILASIAIFFMFSRSLRDLSTVAETVGTVHGAPLEVADHPTEFKEVYAAFQRMRTRVDHLLSEKDVVLGAIGHDLRTPLTALRLRIETIQDDNRRAEMVTQVNQITQFLDDIVASVHPGRNKQRRTKYDLTQILEDIVSDYLDRGWQVTCACQPNLVAICDATAIRRMVQNLVNNAVKYAGSAHVSVDVQNEHILFTVEDNGPGIPQDDMANVLKPFTRGEGSRSRLTGGSGLGLSIAQMIAHAHGGALSLKNRPEGGLSVQVNIPAGV